MITPSKLAATALALAAHLMPAQAAPPVVSLKPGLNGVEFVACGNRGRQGIVVGYVVGRDMITNPLDERLIGASETELQYHIRVLSRDGAPVATKTFSPNCFEPVTRIGATPPTSQGTPAVTLFIGPERLVCTPAD